MWSPIGESEPIADEVNGNEVISINTDPTPFSRTAESSVVLQPQIGSSTSSPGSVQLSLSALLDPGVWCMSHIDRGRFDWAGRLRAGPGNARSANGHPRPCRPNAETQLPPIWPLAFLELGVRTMGLWNNAVGRSEQFGWTTGRAGAVGHLQCGESTPSSGAK